MTKHHQERGAIAVEFAIVLPVLLLLLMGIAEFGRAYNAQITLTHAAREGARVMAISQDPLLAKEVVKDAATALNPALTDGNILIGNCVSDTDVTLTINYELDTLTGFMGPFDITGKAVMRCGG